MKQLIRLDRPVIVEGKYDKITLENVIDALIIPTNGFSIFKDREKCAMIRLLAREKGIIVMTDSDSAGAVIRSYIKKIAGDSDIINVYVPELKGKEKRKAKPSKEGTLGVEGMSAGVIVNALERSGVFSEKSGSGTRKITKTDMFVYSLSGGDNSAGARKDFLKFQGLPQSLSPSAMLDVINCMFGFEEFRKKAEEWQKKRDRK